MLRKIRASGMTQARTIQRSTSDSVFASQCLGEFLARVRRVDPHPAVLDLGVLCGANIAFLGENGCRVSVESLPSPSASRTEDGASTGTGPAEALKVPLSPLKYPPETFSGVLAWDAIARMPVKEAGAFVETLWRLLLDGGVILAYFPGPPGHPGGHAGRYRILEKNRLKLEPTKVRAPGAAPAYQNREIYSLFSRFEVVRLSQLKSGTREVLVARTRRPARH